MYDKSIRVVVAQWIALAAHSNGSWVQIVSGSLVVSGKGIQAQWLLCSKTCSEKKAQFRVSHRIQRFLNGHEFISVVV